MPTNSKRRLSREFPRRTPIAPVTNFFRFCGRRLYAGGKLKTGESPMPCRKAGTKNPLPGAACSACPNPSARAVWLAGDIRGKSLAGDGIPARIPYDHAAA